MNFVADEGVDKAIVLTLRQNKYKVYYIAEEQPSIDDEFVLAKSNELNAILITSDKDFGELIFNRRLSSCGVILLRLEGSSQKEKIEIVINAINNNQLEMFEAFTVISKKHIRIRKLN